MSLVVCCRPVEDFEPVPWADPECADCGGDGKITNEDQYTPYKSVFADCHCIRGEAALAAAAMPYVDLDCDGWLDGVVAVPARYAGSERALTSVRTVVMHSLSKGAGPTGPAYFANPGDGRLVSAHLVVHRSWDRPSTQCVPITRIAHHARGYNNDSIGLETDGPFRPGQYTDDMYDEIKRLIETFQSLGCPIESIISHRSTAPKRRRDPGDWFDWVKLEDLGLELVP